ncbi:YrzI family small protein [Aeribacillus kexueae]|nr:YrzI family small protein [Bacillus kexueae]
MTINLFFILIHIEKRKKSLEEIEHEQYVEQLMEEVKNRQFKLYRGI